MRQEHCWALDRWMCFPGRRSYQYSCLCIENDPIAVSVSSHHYSSFEGLVAKGSNGRSLGIVEKGSIWTW